MSDHCTDKGVEAFQKSFQLELTQQQEAMDAVIRWGGLATRRVMIAAALMPASDRNSHAAIPEWVIREAFALADRLIKFDREIPPTC